MKKYKIISHQIVFYEYEVQAESMEEAKDKVESWGTPEDGVKLVSKDTNPDDFDPIIHSACEEIL